MSETVDILVRGKDGASAAFNSARSSLTSLGNTAGTATVSLGNLGKSIGTVGLAAAGLAAAGVAAATAAVGAFGVSAVNVAGNFEQAMANVGAISGATDDELAALTQTARDLGASTSFSATEAAEGMQFLAMAGFDVADSIAAMPGLLGLAAATQMDLGRAADITSNIMSGFGIAAEESGRVADILAYTASNANTDVLQLGEAMKYAAPVAASLGISIEDTATAIAVMADSGIQGSMAGTAIRGAFLRLASPAKDATKLMEDLGIKVFDAQGSMLPLPEVIANMNRGMGNMSDQQRAAALQTLVGTEAMGGFLALLNAGPEALAEFSGAVAESGGTAQTMAEKQLATYQGRLKLLSSAFESLQITVGTAMLPALTKGVELLTSGVGVVDQWAQSLMESGVLGQMWAQVLAFAAPIIERLSAGLSTLGAFVMGTVVPAVQAFIAVMAETLPPIIEAVGPIIETLISTYLERLASYLEVGAWLWSELIGPAILAVAQWITDDLMPALSDAADLIGTALAPHIETLAGFITGTVIPAVMEFGATVGTWIIGAIEKAAPIIATLVDWFVTKLMPALTNAGTTIMATLIPRLQSLWGFVQEKILPIVMKFAQWIGDNLPGAINVLSPLIATLVDVGLTNIENYLRLIVQVWETALQPALSSMMTWIGDVTGGWGNLTLGAKEAQRIIGELAGKVRELFSMKMPEWMSGGIKMPEFKMPKLPGFAGGVTNFAGGAAIVGERGPELVTLPRGSNVTPAAQTRQLMAQAPTGGGGTSVNLTVAPVINGMTVDSAERVQQVAAQIAAQVRQMVDQEFGRAIDGLILGNGAAR